MKTIVGGIAVLILCAGRSAWAQELAPTDVAPQGVDGLPGLYRLPVVAEAAPRVGAVLWMGYGYTEPQNGQAGSHHRVAGTTSVGGAITKYAELSLRYDVRYDLHPADEGEHDDGTVMDLTPIVRAGIPLGALRLGAEGRFLMAGAGQDDIPVPTPEARFIFNYLKDGYVISGFGGYRFPYFGHDDIDAARLRDGDRVALGVSEFPMITTGVGVMKKLSRLSLLGELSWDIAVGEGAPSAWESPLRLGLGSRFVVVPGLHMSAMLEVCPGARAASTVDDPLVPIEPRVAGMLGLGVSWPGLGAKPKPKRTPEVSPRPPVKSKPVVVPAPPLPKAQLRVEVSEEGGHPISDARVKVLRQNRQTGEMTSLELPLEELNRYSLGELEPGHVEVSVEAELLQSYVEEVELRPGEDQVVVVQLRKAVGREGQLRGLVRSFAGQGVAARVRVQPGGQEVVCDAEGEFKLELLPGTYEIIIDAEGYVVQRRPVRIRKDGVTVLNADLQRSH